MKQKNLILMVVAVGCGLLAAFLTSQMSAKPAAAPQTVEVLVVAKELPPGTKFTVDSIKDQFKKKNISPDVIPEKAVVTEDLLVDKVLNKTLRVDDFLRESDLGNYTPLDPPEGKHIVTIRLSVDKMTPFIHPTSKVDMMATRITEGNKGRATILIPNVLVMAVDEKVNLPGGGPEGNLAIQLVSVAVSREEAVAIRLAEATQAKLSFILRSTQGTQAANEEFDLAKALAWINDEGEGELKPETPETPEAKPETTKITVPLKDLPAGTELTSDVLEKNFKEVNWHGAAPSSAITNIKAHAGHFLLKDVAAEQFVPKSYVAEKLPQVAEAPKGKAGEGSAPQIKPDLPPPVVVEKLETFDRSYTTIKGTQVYRYEIQKDGKLRILGEVTAEGNLVPMANAPKKDEPKSDDDAAPGKKTI